MFSLFTGKISGVFSLALQGISKALGFVIETVTSVVDTVVETVGTLTSPLTDTLTSLPLVGGTVESVLDLKSNLVGNLSEGLHSVASDLSEGDLLGGVNTALNSVTATLGETIADGANILSNVIDVTTPVTGLLSELPGLGDILNAAGETTSNLIGFVEETGDYVASIHPTDLVNGLLSDPTGSVGGVIQDASGSLENLLNDLVPITDVVSTLPVVGDAVTVAGQLAGSITDGLYDVGSLLGQVDLLDPFQSNGSLI